MSNPWADIVGPCYTVASMARVLGWTEEDVRVAGEELRLLALVTSDGVTLYPAFQLEGTAVVEGLPEVLQILRTGVDDPWTWAQWLNVPLDTTRNIDALRLGRLEDVLRDARHVAWSWSN